MHTKQSQQLLHKLKTTFASTIIIQPSITMSSATMCLSQGQHTVADQHLYSRVCHWKGERDGGLSLRDPNTLLLISTTLGAFSIMALYSGVSQCDVYN